MKFHVLVLLLLTGTFKTAASSQPELKKASGHPMQYYISLPEGWNPTRKWPIVVVIEAAEKEFKVNAQRFAEANKRMNFIVVAPIIVSNGNQGHRDSKIYPYSNTVWDDIDKRGVCTFDEEGLTQVIKDVQKEYNAESKYFITGFEAGAHLVWAMTFLHPEQLKAAAPIAGNYRGRCMETDQFSVHPSRVNLPVMGFTGQNDGNFGPGGMIHDQWNTAKKLAIDHGYKNISETIVPGKGHVPMPDEVLKYFASIK
ncbi:hypothetical protein BEL04_07740 [Mucilaginibacter sp. PPCGB 2223]|uniref:alpha/beta hydrolase-fold protein n=1 Tax=Mucilaginibacter sp. PPCGB 2223 TaxID=1886027 RepID=UPI000825A992|nr:alpha/beta hydrolase-fold protein [Mucilaginibacter sp. PPCGB 2223]OCX54150.1 hypothetical protein BEL04_07740 [Mucilaginibacter sp. PPCGB 2223]